MDAPSIAGDKDRWKQILAEVLRHLPREIVSMVSEGQVQTQVEKIVMFIDVSGFTAMTEKYSAKARAGIDALTTELNKYLSRIVDHIRKNHGQVMKFAGDAILACWPSDGGALAIECAIDIQQTCSNYMTTCPEDGKDNSTELNVRIVIGRGNVDFIIVSTPLFSHYLLLGPAIDQIREIEPASEIRTIVLSREFWEAISEQWQQQLCAHAISENGAYIKVAFSARRHRRRDGVQRVNEIAQAKMTVSFADRLSKFVIDPVFEKISNLEPLKYASEMRYLSICFINIILQRPENMAKAINDIFVQIDTVSRSYDGILTKSVGFDKGLSFLCLFGLAATESNPSASALDAAEEIRTWLCSLDHLAISASIGVASGITYCGVVGHPERHEYSSIGRRVNLSARLMCYYPDIVSCDEETAEKSRLPRCYFRQLPAKAMKGFKDSITAFEYRRCEENRTSFIQREMDTSSQDSTHLGLYGRRLEIMVVCAKIVSMLGQSEPNNYGYGLVFRGEDGSGRSKLLQHLFNVLKNGPKNLEVLLIKCLPTRTKAETSLGYQGLMTVLGHMLHLELMNADQRKELHDKLCKTVQPISSICELILTEWLNVDEKLDFAERAALTTLHDSAAMMELIEIVMKYLQAKKYIILLDDLHHVDEESLRIITHISRPPHSILIGTGRLGDKILEMCPSDGRCHVDFKTLLSIKEVQMRDLLCRIFRVQSIEKGLLRVLHQRTRGLPGLCLEAVVELRRSSLVDIRDLPREKDLLSLASKPPPVVSKCNLLVDLFFERVPESENPVSKAIRDLYCSNGDPSQLDMPTTIEAAFMKQYDRLSAFQKSLLSNCSILGSTFSRDYLFGTCRGNLTKHTFNVAIKTLFENQMLICAYNDEHMISSQIRCCCPGNFTKLPFFCKIFRFCHESIRTIVLSSMTRQTIRYRKINALEWLEAQLPDTIASSIQWPMCGTKGRVGITLAESYLLRSSMPKSTSLLGLVNMVRINSLQVAMMVENGQAPKKNEDRRPSLETNPGRQQTSKWSLVKKSVHSGAVACHFLRIEPLTVRMKDGRRFKTREADIFQCWNFIDERNRVCCFSFGKIFSSANLKTKTQTSTMEEVKRDRVRFPLNYESVEKRRKSTVDDSPNTSGYCNCDERLRGILEEVVKHCLDIRQEEKTCYYSLQLALLLIKNQRPLLARKVMTCAEKFTHEKNLVLQSFFCYVQAKYEFWLSHNCAKAMEYLLKALSLVRHCKHSYWSTKKNHHCSIMTDNRSINIARRILVFMYVVASADCNEAIADRERTMKNAAEQLEILSRTVVRPDDVQTILVLSEEYYKDSLAHRTDEPSAYCADYREMFEYLKRTLRMVRHDALDTVSGTIYACLNYVCLEWVFSLSQAFEYASMAFTIFFSFQLIEQVALLLPYLCLTCAAVDELDVLSDRLDDFKKMLNDCSLREGDLRRSLYCSLYKCLLLDLTASYGITASAGDLGTIASHLRLVYDEITTQRDELSFVKFRPCLILYCLAVVSKAYADCSDKDNSSTFMKLAFREAETQVNHLSMLDPLTQRSLLLLSESQLVNSKDYEPGYQNDLTSTPFILVMHCVHRRSLNYPMYCMLNAVAVQTSSPLECKTWTKKAIHSAIQLGSQCELDRIYELASKRGLHSRTASF